MPLTYASQLNLAWKLSLVLKNLAPSSLLDSYSEERLPVVKNMLNLTTVMLEQRVSFKAGAEDTSHIRRPKTLHQLGVNYRSSSIVVDEQPGAEEAKSVSPAYAVEDPSVLRAGDRAPDAPGLRSVGGSDEAVISIFSVFKPTQHTAFIFTSDPAEAKPILEALKVAPAATVHTVLVLPKGYDTSDLASLKSVSADAILVDQEGHAYTYYPPASAGFSTIVVRPDGVVGAVAKSVDGVAKYIKGVFGL